MAKATVNIPAAGVRADDQAFSDVRISALGAVAGYNAFEALGRLMHLWRWCTQRGTYIAPETVVRIMLGPLGVDAILDADLGERVKGGIRVRGTQGRTEWAAELAAKRKAAGEARATAPRDERGRLRPSRQPAHDQHVLEKDQHDTSASPPSDQQDPASRSRSRSRVRSNPPSGEEGDRFALAPQEPRNPSAPKPALPGQQETVAAFHDAYLAQNGVAPTWGPKQAGQIKRLVSAHGAEEVQRRIAILFGGQGPAFIAAPFDVGTLAQHFDKLAQPSAHARASPQRFGTSDPGQIAYDELQRLRAAERDVR